MVQPCSESDLAKKPIGSESRRKVGVENFYSDIAPVPEILGEVYGGHATTAQLTLDPVFALQRLRQFFLHYGAQTRCSCGTEKLRNGACQSQQIRS